jgi:hypothetical protein
MIDRTSGAGRVVTDDLTPETLSAVGETVFVSDPDTTAAYQRQT